MGGSRNARVHRLSFDYRSARERTVRPPAPLPTSLRTAVASRPQERLLIRIALSLMRIAGLALGFRAFDAGFFRVGPRAVRLTTAVDFRLRALDAVISLLPPIETCTSSLIGRETTRSRSRSRNQGARSTLYAPLVNMFEMSDRYNSSPIGFEKLTPIQSRSGSAYRNERESLSPFS